MATRKSKTASLADKIAKDMMKEMGVIKTPKKARKVRGIKPKYAPMFDEIAQCMIIIMSDPNSRVPGEPRMPETVFKQALSIVSNISEDKKKEVIEFYNKAWANKDTLFEKVLNRCTELKAVARENKKN